MNNNEKTDDNNLWNTSFISNTEEAFFRDDLEELKELYNLDKYNVVKETIQSSLDAMLSEEHKPVGIIIKTGKESINDHSDSGTNIWPIYSNNTGIYFEESDNELEKMRYGSHGIGKIASCGVSDAYMVFFY